MDGNPFVDEVQSFVDSVYTQATVPHAAVQDPATMTPPVEEDEDPQAGQPIIIIQEREKKKDLDFSRMTNGVDFLFGASAETEPLWGTQETTLWNAGEGLMFVGPTGVGKTTLGSQIMRSRLGIGPEDVLGMPVAKSEKGILYIAADRPRQAARALTRLFDGTDEEQKKILEEKLTVWKGPLPDQLLERNELLLEMCEHADADTIIIDSVKDVVPEASKEASGTAYNNAIQHCLASGIEVMSYHHTRKAANGISGVSTGLKSIDDIFGSTMITAGQGSIFAINGEAGNSIVRLVHLKQPNEPFGPVDVEHDHTKGTSEILNGYDPLKYLRSLPKGCSAAEAAVREFGGVQQDRNQINKSRRKLEKLVEKGLAKKIDGVQGGLKGGTETRYEAIETKDWKRSHEKPRKPAEYREDGAVIASGPVFQEDYEEIDNGSVTYFNPNNVSPRTDGDY